MASHTWGREIFRARSKSQLPSRGQIVKGVHALKVELSKLSKVTLREVLCRSSSVRSCCYVVMDLYSPTAWPNSERVTGLLQFLSLGLVKTTSELAE